MAVEFGLAIGEMIIKYTIAPIGHQLGYLIHYGRNIDDLRAQVDSLRNVGVVVEGHVTAAERNGDIIRPYVKDWIDKANNIVEESERLLDHEVNIGNQRCSLRSCPKYLVSRYKVSRKANKKKMVVDEHFDRRNKWIDPLVSDPAPTPTIGAIYRADAEDLESRKSIINDVMAAIKDDKYNVIGVHGMGGIGKTTLAKEVAKIAEEDKLFEVITPVVAVSQTPSIMKIQHEIAARLGMNLDEKENEEMRAGRLHARIMKEKSFLVILDDLWAELKLKDIGIPTPSVHHKGCKILLTTRSQQVCNQMGSQRAFPINVLTEGEAWKLFKENAGDDTVDSPNILPIATQVAKECAGLPLAIVLVARALMKRGQSVWEDTLHRLQNHELNSIEVKLHESLKLSYDFLREEDKSCLLLCCLAPEDSEISVIELARWGMGLRLFKNVWKWVEVRNRVRTSIDNLKACSLLLESTRQECVRMHDVVRDFAISIASESKRGIWARIDFGRSEWSDNYLLPLNNNDTTIAVLNNFHHLPAQIDCPKLNLLLLEEFDSSTELPEKLFNRMTELRVLSMVGMSIPEEKGLPWITELRGLEILRISRSSDIFVLPREIGELTRLRILDLSGCKGLRRIPAGVLSRLSQLEGLYMDRCFDIKWGEDDSSASLDELKGLSNLSDLHMHLDNHNAQHFPQDIQLPMRLSEFQFHLGRRDYYLFKPNIPKTLVVEGYDAKRIASHQGFKMLLNMAEYLILFKMEDVECFLSDVKRQGFSTLKRLDVYYDSTVEYLANYTTKEGGVMILPRPKVFPVLETLQLFHMYNLKEICHGQLPAGSFCELTLIYVQSCPELKKLINICSQNIANGFGQQLHEISISCCHNLEEIFTYDDDDDINVGVEEETNEIIMLPKLRILSLQWTPNLATFCSKRSTPRTILQQHQTIFFPEKIVFSNLNKLVVSGSFEEIWPPQIPSNSFCRLTDLEIGGCDKLKIAIPSNMVQRLRNNLKRLVIRTCKMMKEIVANTELGSGANQEGAHHGSSSVLEFPSLEELSIKNCPKIETIVARIAEGNLDDTAQVLFNDKIIFPKLQTLKIINGNFEQIWSPRVEIHMEENFCILRVLEIDGCQKLKKVIPYNLAKSLHALEEMTVKNCALVEEVVHEEVGESVHGEEILFPHLRKVEIDNCGGLRHLFSHSQAKLDFSQLKELEISSCKIMKEILLQESAEEDEEDNASFLRFPQLDSLRLFDLQELTCFYHGNYSLEFPSLKNLTIEKCPKMETVAFDDDVRVNTLLNEKIIFPKLHTLKVSGNFEQIKSPRVVYRMEENFRILRVLILDGCQKLKKAIPYNLAKSLHALEEITVKNCDLVEEVVEEVEESVHGEEILFPHMRKIEIGSCGGLKHLFSHSQAKLYFMKELLLQESVEEEEEDEEDKSSFLRFPQLDSLRLFRLQELTCFYHGHYTLEFPSLKKLTIEECPKMETGAFDDDVMVNSLLNEKVLLPTLDELNIIGLKCVKEIRYRQLPAKSFRQLSILKVSGCDSLRNLLTPSIVKHLSRLRMLEIRSCTSLEAVLVDANEEEQVSDMQDKDVVFPRVHWLTLESLPNLRSFYSGGLTLEFPSFDYFYLAGCPQMQTFSSGRVVTPKLNDITKQHLFQEKTKASLPALARLIHSNDEYDLTDACRALSYLSNDNIQAVIESGVCPRLVELLLHESPSVFIPALRTVGNIVTGNDVQTQVIIVHQALPCLLNLLSSDYEKSIKKDACRIISNITAGNRDQIQAVIEAGIIAPLVQLLQNDEFEIKEEAALAISNATSRGINEQIKFLVGQGCIKPLCDLLVCTNPRIVTVCLKGLENILKVGEVEKNLGNTGDVNLYAQLIDEAEGLEKIKNLQMHDNNEIYEKAMKILETYWLKEDELPLGDASQTGFHLGGKKLPVPSCGFNFS